MVSRRRAGQLTAASVVPEVALGCFFFPPLSGHRGARAHRRGVTDNNSGSGGAGRVVQSQGGAAAASAPATAAAAPHLSLSDKEIAIDSRVGYWVQEAGYTRGYLRRSPPTPPVPHLFLFRMTLSDAKPSSAALVCSAPLLQ